MPFETFKKGITNAESIHGAEFKDGAVYDLSTGLTKHGVTFKKLRIENNQKLGNILLTLPYGLVDKQITGIGATHLELNAKRNSIIVEPIKAIAYSKAKKEHLYVGSPIGTIKNSISPQDIKEYCSNGNYKYKKILVVADSLKKVIQAIGESVYSDYFLMIDEIDTFQTDGNFRDKLEQCLDYYKNFEEHKRALVTATMIAFSDPQLLQEKRIQIDYLLPETRTIKLVNTNTINAVAANIIKELYATGRKILIAYNIIKEIRHVIQILEKEHGISSSEFAILCSKSSAKTAGNFRKEILEEKLPSKINFMTSAYFTGIDISEDIHCVSICNGDIPFTLLSEHKLKQIAGRCRKKLLSETIVFSLFKRALFPYEELDENGLLKIAKKQLSAMTCFESQYASDKYLLLELKKTRKAIINRDAHKGLSFIRESLDGKVEISYFNIDSSMEITRVKKELYRTENQLRQILEKAGHKISNYESYDLESKTKYTNDSNSTLEELMSDVIEELENLEDDNQAFYDLRLNSESYIQERACDWYQKLLNFFDRQTVINLIKQYLPQDHRHFKTFIAAVYFEKLPDSTPFKLEVYNTFPIGSQHTKLEINSKLGKIFDHNHLSPLKNPQATLKLESYLKTKEVRHRRGGKDQMFYKIIGKNPFEIHFGRQQDVIERAEGSNNFMKFPVGN